MGLFRSYRSKLHFLRRKQLFFSIDAEPTLAAESTTLLKGWAFDHNGPVRYQLVLAGEVILDDWCRYPRFDVARRFTHYDHSFLSGFEIQLPVHLLQGIPRGALVLRIVGHEGVEAAWEWKEQGTEEDRTSELKKYFSESRPLVPAEHAQANSPLHIVVETCGRYGFLRENLNLLAAVATAPKMMLATVTLLLADELETGERDAIRKLIPDALVPFTRLMRKSEFLGWNSLRQLSGEKKNDGTVFYLHEDVDISYLDLPSFKQDFHELPLISVLMPAIYGGKTGVKGPAGLRLCDFPKELRTSGVKIPALFATRSLFPIWMTSLSFLCAFEGATPFAKNSAGERSFVFPSAGHFVSHVQLCQPVVSRGGLSFGFDESERRQIEVILQNECDFRKRESVSKIGMILLAADWEPGSEVHGTGYQILSLARELMADGTDLLFVVDSDSENSPLYVREFPVVTLRSIVPKLRTLNVEWVLATDWSTVRASNVVRFLTGCRVFNFIQEVEYPFYGRSGREHQQNAIWANRGDFLPLVSSDAIRPLLQAECDGMENAVHYPVRVNHSVFFPYPITRKKAVLFVVGDDSHSDQTFLSSLITGLQKVAAEVDMTLLGIGKEPILDEKVLSLFEQVHCSSSAADLARFYSAHQVVVFVGQLRGSHALALEALRCGAIPLRTHGVLQWNEDQPAGFLKSSAGDSPLECVQRIDAALAGKPPAEFEYPAFETSGGDSSATNLRETLDASYQSYTHRLQTLRQRQKRMSIIIPVYGALDATLMCLRSLLLTVANDAEIIIVNDASDAGTTECLQNLADEHQQVTLVNLQTNVGFVQACLAGFHVCDPENDIVLLNSDVVLAKETLYLLQQACYSSPQVGLASALSTNSPHLQLNLNVGDSLEQAAENIRAIYQPKYPTIITPEGQLLYIRRWAIEKFGFFDAVYGRGFCEESDMCMRMFLHGVDMVVADNALIFHRRSASFGSNARSEQLKLNRPIFDSRYGQYYQYVYPVFLENDPLREVREKYAALQVPLRQPDGPFALNVPKLHYLRQTTIGKARQQSILDDTEFVFILPGVVLGGGSLSVLQHMNEMLLRGRAARVISLGPSEIGNYPRLAPIIELSLDELFELDWTRQKVIATFWTTAYVVQNLCAKFSGLEGYYYVQDYEPWFYSHPEQFGDVKDAEQSYELGLTSVVKTDFLKDLLRINHHLDAKLITPGIDRGTFYRGAQDSYWGRPRLAALYRPRTTRRGHRETIEVLRMLRRRLPELAVSLFGEVTDFPEDLLSVVDLKGNLSPEKVARLYRESDIVLDLSYWQGFGRMGIEGMACGAVPVLSQSGGILRYAVDGENSFVVDGKDLRAAADRIVLLAKDRTLRLQTRAKGLESVKQFSEEKAVDDWLQLFATRSSTPEFVPIDTTGIGAERKIADG